MTLSINSTVSRTNQ